MSPGHSALVLCIVALLSVTPSDLPAQIRPLEPLDLCVYACGRHVVVEVGVAAYDGQRASLAGVEGRLIELGRLRVLWRMDRVAFQASGTVWRRLDGPRPFAEPVDGVVGGHAERLGDVGDFRLETIIALVRTEHLRAVLRFGTRLPTTDDRIGLERDRTDFFALVGGHLTRGSLTVTLESGLGIHGAYTSTFDQVDVWLYSAALEYDLGALVPSVAVAGQADGLSGPPVRGNENLQEARFGLRIGRDQWVRIVAVTGLTEFSPTRGVEVAVGAAF